MVFAITYFALGVLWQSFKGYPTDWSWKDWASILVLGAVLGLLVLVLIAGGVTGDEGRKVNAKIRYFRYNHPQLQKIFPALSLVFHDLVIIWHRAPFQIL